MKNRHFGPKNDGLRIRYSCYFNVNSYFMGFQIGPTLEFYRDDNTTQICTIFDTIIQAEIDLSFNVLFEKKLNVELSNL